MAQRHYRLQVNVLEGSMLVVSCLFASLLIFVFGVYVGKEVQAQKTFKQAKPLRVPVGGVKTALLDRSPASPLGPRPVVPTRERAIPHRVQQPKPISLPAAAVLAKAGSPASSEAKPRTRPTIRERPAAAPPPKPPAKPRPWSVQVQATTREKTARRTAQRLRQQGYSPSLSKVIRQGKVWYRVRVGPFTEREAKAAISRFRRQKMFAQAYPVSH